MATSGLPRQAPSALAIADHIRSRITSGEWVVGDQIDSENSLCQAFGVCRATVTKAIKRLESEGLIISQHGKGRFVADAPVRKRTWAVGLIFSDIERLTHPVVAPMIAGAKDRILESDYHLKIVAINSTSRQLDTRRSEQALALIDPANLDGAIIMTREMPDADALMLARHVPVLYVSRSPVRGSMASICYDAAGGSHDAAAHLRDLGHRRVTLVTVEPSSDQGRLQAIGAELAFRKLIAAGDAMLTVERVPRNRSEYSRKIMLDRLADKARPTAVIAGSDELALGVYQAATELGLDIPRDLSLTGWNDTLASDIPVPMTTVTMDYQAYARTAVDCLLGIIDRNLPLDHYQQTPVELIVRESTAPPARH